jgi:hypothetical protein
MILNRVMICEVLSSKSLMKAWHLAISNAFQ